MENFSSTNNILPHGKALYCKCCHHLQSKPLLEDWYHVQTSSGAIGCRHFFAALHGASATWGPEKVKVGLLQLFSHIKNVGNSNQLKLKLGEKEEEGEDFTTTQDHLCYYHYQYEGININSYNIVSINKLVSSAASSLSSRETVFYTFNTKY